MTMRTPQLLILAGCDQPCRTVNTWLDQKIAGRAPYNVQGVSGYTLVAYKIVRSTNGILTV
jgi:hypothetical protein